MQKSAELNENKGVGRIALSGCEGAQKSLKGQELRGRKWQLRMHTDKHVSRGIKVKCARRGEVRD